MVNWPSQFPALFQSNGFTYEPVSNTTPIEPESGELMTRVRFTGESDVISGTLIPVSAETATDILNFWRYDLKNGSQRLLWDDPLTLEAREYLMLETPKLTPMSGGWWRVGLKLQSMAI